MMNWMNTLTMAMTGGMGGGSTGGGSGSMTGLVGYMAIFFAIFYFMMIRPQQRKEKERKEMVSSIKTGDRVLLNGGILGTIANVKEKTFIIKIADNVKVEVVRGAVSKVLENGENVDAVSA